MDIPEETITDFIRGWKQEFGEELSRDEARSQASRLLDFFLKLAEPLPSELEERKSHAAS
jgi:hypothetical protein